MGESGVVALRLILESGLTQVRAGGILEALTAMKAMAESSAHEAFNLAPTLDGGRA